MKHIKMELYNGDCLKFLDDLISNSRKVDCIITDPPYGMEFRSSHRKKRYDVIKNDDNLDWLDEFVEKSYMLLKDNSHAYFFCSWHKVDVFKQALEKKFTVKNVLIWEKNNTGMGDLFGDYAPKYEMILFCTKGKRKLNGNRDSNMLRFARTNNVCHPTQKPVDLIRYLIEKSTNKNDIVGDFFFGSGTTGVASLQSNRSFIGAEIEKTHFDTGVKRIKDAHTSMGFFKDKEMEIKIKKE